MFFTLIFMLVTMFTITSCNSNDGKMFIVEDKPGATDYMGASRFDTLFIHEQIQPDKSIKYTFEYRRWCHDIYIVEDYVTAYDKYGKRISQFGFVINIPHVRSRIDNIIGRIMEDNNVSEDDKSYIKAAYKQIYLENYLVFPERCIYKLVEEVNSYKLSIEKCDPKDEDKLNEFRQLYNESKKWLDIYMGMYPNVDTANVYKLYE